MILIDEIKEVHEWLKSMKDEIGFRKDIGLSDEESDRLSVMVRRFASYLPSPSMLNAYSVIYSNEPEKLAEWLEDKEAWRKASLEGLNDD